MDIPSTGHSKHIAYTARTDIRPVRMDLTLNRPCGLLEYPQGHLKEGAIMESVGTLESKAASDDGYFCRKHRCITSECKQGEDEHGFSIYFNCSEETDHEYYEDFVQLDALMYG